MKYFLINPSCPSRGVGIGIRSGLGDPTKGISKVSNNQLIIYLMKKPRWSALLLLLPLIFCTVTSLNAQDKSQFGFRAGTNVAWLESDHEDYNPRTTFNIAAFYQYYFYKQFSIQPEISFAGKGADDVRYFGTIDTRLKLSYLDFPLLLKYTFSPENVSFSLFSGPLLGFKLDAELEDKPTGVTVPADDYIRDTNWAIVSGLEVGIPFRKIMLLIDVRYEIGVVDAVGSNPDLNVLSTTVGVGF